MNLKDIATSPGIEELGQQLGTSDPAVMEKVRALVERALAKRPDLAQTEVRGRQGLNNAYYNFDNKSVTTGLMDPDVMAHEIGHAQNTADNPNYQRLLKAVRGLASINGMAAIPAMLGMHAFMGDQSRKDVVNSLAGVSAALAGPILLEEASASANAVMNSDDKIRTLKRVLPALGAHAASSALPAILYQIDARL